jgi:hypothetical protein
VWGSWRVRDLLLIQSGSRLEGADNDDNARGHFLSEDA